MNTHITKKSSTSYIVITGGVCSSLGKGVLTSAIGVLLQRAGYTVSVMKLDPYLNVDPGTMSPLMHGEVFVTADGAETDLDLGHYERTLRIQLTRESSVSSGQIFKEIIDHERAGNFLGGCIQMVPHATNALSKRIIKMADAAAVDVLLIEVGGTVGDIEGSYFLETIRRFKSEIHTKLLHCHLSMIPFLAWTKEYKTKPTQHSVARLKEAGLIPDMLFLRVDNHIPREFAQKLSVQCDVARDRIFQSVTHTPMYQLFLDLHQQGLGETIQKALGMSHINPIDMSDWEACINRIHAHRHQLRIGIIAKYIGADPYISIIESIRSAGYAVHAHIEIITIIAEHLENPTSPSGQDAWQLLASVDGIIVPGGFDARGFEGKVAAAHYARTHNIPYFGLCLGMQVMLIEAARSLLNLPDAHSTEINKTTSHPVIALLSEQAHVIDKGATMRLGVYPCRVSRGTKAYEAYQQEHILERHRHRYEFNMIYRKRLEDAGVVFSGINEEQQLIEIAEIKDHPFMVGTQFHPEFQSSPLAPHPLFTLFIETSLLHQEQENRKRMSTPEYHNTISQQLDVRP